MTSFVDVAKFSAGIKLFFLPKYSPDLNSIEQVSAKLKRLPQKGRQSNPVLLCLWEPLTEEVR